MGFRELLSTLVAEELVRHPIEQPLTDDVASAEAFRSGGQMVSRAATEVADELLQEALASGFPLGGHTIEKNILGGGNTAEVVARLTLNASFAFKCDSNASKLAEEGEVMRRIKRNDLPGISLSQRFRQAWPEIYAVRRKPPYAYLMEFFPRTDGWISLEDRLYPAVGIQQPAFSDAGRWINTVLDLLFDGYQSSIDRRRRPSLGADYVTRIQERLIQTAELDKRFSPRPIIINGQRMRPWTDYLEDIEKRSSFLDEMTPQFSTVTHGDPNPGNLMIRSGVSQVEIKLIDPKDWMTGDYLFDITKLTHFLEATGPVEKPFRGDAPTTRFELTGNTAHVEYAFDTPAWTSSIIDSCLTRSRQFALANGDRQWQARYELGMCANLLGLPLGRVTKGHDSAALILFSEGLRWLDRCCERLGSAARQFPVVEISVMQVEPQSLVRTRDTVRQYVGDVIERENRRGFEILRWKTNRYDVELSLEHEARLIPIHEGTVGILLEKLARSEGRPVRETLLPGADERTRLLIVRRYERALGPQSIDHYYDYTTLETAKSMIAQQWTVRERIRASDFMTWRAQDSTSRPLSIELPFVAIGDDGVSAHLEFNWIDDLSASVREAMTNATVEGGDARANPFWLAMQFGSSPDGLAPVLEHTTFRQKFGLFQPARTSEDEQEILTINVDFVVAQDVRSRRVGTFHDIDISSCKRIDDGELAFLADFAREFSFAYRLSRNPGTKAWRGAVATGLLTR